MYRLLGKADGESMAYDDDGDAIVSGDRSSAGVQRQTPGADDGADGGLDEAVADADILHGATDVMDERLNLTRMSQLPDDVDALDSMNGGDDDDDDVFETLPASGRSSDASDSPPPLIDERE